MKSESDSPIDFTVRKASDVNNEFGNSICKNLKKGILKKPESRFERTESVCSSGKISEVDSGCGNSIHSNSSGSDDEINNNDKQNYGSNEASDPEEKKARNPMCARCRNHGDEIPVKGHKRKCPFRNCECDLCDLTDERRKLMAKTISVKRRQKEDMADGTYVAPEPAFKKKRSEEKNNQMDGTDSDNRVDNYHNNCLPKSDIKGAFEKILYYMSDCFNLNSINKFKNYINCTAQSHNSETNESFSYLSKVLSEYEPKAFQMKEQETKFQGFEEDLLNRAVPMSNSEAKHGAWNIVNHQKKPNLRQTEMPTIDHPLSGSKSRSVFPQNLPIVHNHHLQPYYIDIDNNTIKYANTQQLYPYTTNATFSHMNHLLMHSTDSHFRTPNSYSDSNVVSQRTHNNSNYNNNFEKNNINDYQTYKASNATKPPKKRFNNVLK